MTKQTGPFALVLVAGLSAALPLLARGPLTFEERVEAQEAIEQVYYDHRIWPKENPGPKPPFEQVMPRAVLEAKVTDYLKKCSALERFWQRPIEPSQLQAEMDRMAKGTKDPAMLRELFAALGNDPSLVAECLARPILAERLLSNWYASDTRFHAGARETAERALKEITPESFQAYPSGEFRSVTYVLKRGGAEGENGPQEKRDEIAVDKEAFDKVRRESLALGAIGFKETPEAFLLTLTVSSDDTEIALATRAFAKTSRERWWEAAEKELEARLPDGPSPDSAAYQLRAPESACDEQWLGGTLTFPPDGRYFHTAIWTGTEMIVWGGEGSGGYALTGGRYAPGTDTWTATSTGANCPSARYYHTAVWTGTEMIVWGGTGNCGYEITGGRYAPGTDTWTAVSTGANYPPARFGHTAVWTGTEMIVWGGGRELYKHDDGGRYVPATDTWTATSRGANCPAGRYHHTAVWTGTEMIVWGGYDALSYVNTGGRYTPASNTWATTSTGTNCPSARSRHTAVWTGTEMIVWGGYDGSSFLNTGGRYAPETDTWTATSVMDGPSMRYDHTAVWTGTEMIVWGGYDGLNYLNTGGRYAPGTDTWTATSTGANCPSVRTRHTAIWTGTEMIVWGGQYPYTKTGGRYAPGTDTWTATSTGADCPSPREFHTAVWTGTEMVVWGGYNGSASFSTGGRYAPGADTWTATSTGGDCPSARRDHTAVWTGTEMIVWGGCNGGYLNTGARYAPGTDTWTAASTGAYCPSARSGHSGVWTGTEMIVWGGANGSSYFNTGGRYAPGTDTWTATSVTTGPSARTDHSAVWTGTEMIVWGGHDTGDLYRNTGGRYVPAGDTWRATSTGASCPSGREYHTAVWTGTEMLVWGGYPFYLHGGAYHPGFTPPAVVGPSVCCPAGTIHLTTSIYAGYQWIRNETDIPGATGQSYDATVSGTYSVRVTDQTGCTATSPGKVVTFGYPSPTVTGLDSGCPSPGVTLSTQVYPAYQWIRDGSDIPGATSQDYNATVTGTYSVRVTDACGCMGTSSGKAVTVLSGITPPVYGEGANTCPATSVTLSTDPALSYQWRRDGAVVGGATGQSYLTTVSGSYTVTTSVENGCVGTSAGHAVSIGFCPASEVSPPPAIYPARLVSDGNSSTGFYLYFQRIDSVDGYNLYEGTLGSWYSHANAPGNLCNATVTDLGTGEMRAEILPSAGRHYYLVTAYQGGVEGPSGYDSLAVEIPSSQNTCLP